MRIRRGQRWLMLGRLHIGWLRYWHRPKHLAPVRWSNIITPHVWTLGKIGVRWEMPQPILFPERLTHHSIGWTASP